jgi:hypothetical protein
MSAKLVTTLADRGCRVVRATDPQPTENNIRLNRMARPLGMRV